MQAASKNLSETLSEVYEGDWPGQEQLYVQGQNSEMLWADLAHKLSDQVLIPLNTYQGQFPEMKVRKCRLTHDFRLMKLRSCFKELIFEFFGGHFPSHYFSYIFLYTCETKNSF